MTASLPVAPVSAPGKVLLAGGYLVLDRAYSGLVLGLNARINAITAEIPTVPGVQLTELVVESPQFLHAQWRYGYRRVEEGGGVVVTQLQSGAKISTNPFVEMTLNYALSYIDQVAGPESGHSLAAARIIILADNDYYSHDGGASASATQTGRFAKFPVPLSGANKTGLGSSAALVTSLTASLLTHYLPSSVFDLDSDAGRTTLHNLAQAAHCAAQGKVGSGFDVAAAVFGSCTYRRFSPAVLGSLPEPGAAGFGAQLHDLVHDAARWDTEVDKTGVQIPDGVVLRMCDVDCGSQTVGMVKKVLAWRADNAGSANQLWDSLQARNEDLAAALRKGEKDELPQKTRAVRELIKEMSNLADVPIEPDSQTKLLEGLGSVEGVYGGVVPGAGGFDALAVLMDDNEATTKRVEAFLEMWSLEKASKVKLLEVKGEMQGVRREELDVYKGWL